MAPTSLQLSSTSLSAFSTCATQVRVFGRGPFYVFEFASAA
jgi:hypothetical protein